VSGVEADGDSALAGTTSRGQLKPKQAKWFLSETNTVSSSGQLVIAAVLWTDTAARYGLK
jgi:hypothetical protein